MANKPLFAKQQNSENTDCSFVFKVPSEDGKTSTEKVIHAHKLILSSVSPYFETSFKAEWNRDGAIPITTVEYEIFKKLIEIVYLNSIVLESLDEAAKLCETADFYRMNEVLVVLRAEIPKLWFRHKTVVIGKMLNTAMKCQDWTLLQFFQKVFNTNAAAILGRCDSTNSEIINPIEDWYTYSPEVINFLYASYDIYTSESTLLKALEHYLTHHKIPVDLLKPAIDSIDFQDSSIKTIFDADKLYSLCPNPMVVAGKAKRNEIMIFKEFSMETQKKLIEMFSDTDCWICKGLPVLLSVKDIKHPFYECEIYIDQCGIEIPIEPIQLQSKDCLIAFLKSFKTIEMGGKYYHFNLFDLEKDLKDSFYVL